MTRLLRTGIALAAAVVLAAPVVAEAANFKAHLSGENSVPKRETTATGQATFTPNADQTILEFRITVGNIENVVAVHLQHGASTETGPVIATLYGPVAPGGGRASGLLATGAIASSNLVGDMAGRSIGELIAEIRAGRIYVNVLTDDGAGAPDERPGDFASGEIRGQIQ